MLFMSTCAFPLVRIPDELVVAGAGSLAVEVVVVAVVVVFVEVDVVFLEVELLGEAVDVDFVVAEAAGTAESAAVV